MIEPVLSNLARRHIVLASGSPRRREILKNIRLPFSVIPSNFEENLQPSDFDSLRLFVEENAKLKGEEVAKRIKNQNLEPPHLIISADTVVILENEIIEKPKDPTDAVNILRRLSGKTHCVHTCLALLVFNISKTPHDFRTETFGVDTKVKFAELSEEIIQAYVQTGEPMDKAGAYGIQGIGGSLVESIDGDFYNVMGLPLNTFCKAVHSICHRYFT